MKYTIEGFSQEYAFSLKKEILENGKIKKIKIDCTDLIILRWFVDFYPNMTKTKIDGEEYAWVNYKSILEDLPILDIKKRMLSMRLQKLVDFEILSHTTIKSDGTFAYYGFGKNYKYLLDTECNKLHTVCNKLQRGTQNIAEGVRNKLQRGTQNIAEQNNPSTKYPSIKDSSTKYNSFCSELKATEPKEKLIIDLMLNDKSFYSVYQCDIEKYKELYPAVDVVQEFRKMIGWLDANPNKRKTKTGIKRFINSWLSKAQDMSGNLANKSPTTLVSKQDSKTGNIFFDMLQEGQDDKRRND